MHLQKRKRKKRVVHGASGVKLAGVKKNEEVGFEQN